MLSPKQLGRVEVVSDVAAGGVIPVVSRIEQLRALEVNQTTASQSMTLPSPSDLGVKFGLDVSNVGSASFMLHGQAIPAGSTTRAYWNGTSWSFPASAQENPSPIIVQSALDFGADEPLAPVVGDRYIATDTLVSGVTSTSVTEMYIYEWNGTAWDETIPQHGWIAYVRSADTLYTFNGTTWVADSGSWTLINVVGTLSPNQRYIALVDGIYQMPAGASPGDTISFVNSSGNVSIQSAGGIFFSGPGQVVANPGDALAIPPFTVMQLFNVGGSNWSVIKHFDSRAAIADLAADGQLGTLANLLANVWVLNQTTAGITATLPAQQPLSTQILTIINNGTQSIVIEGEAVPVGAMRRFVALGTTWEPEVVAATQTNWIVATNNIQTVDDGSYVVGAGLTVLLPASPTNGQSVRFAPTGDWASLNVTFSAPGFTVGAGQALPSSSDVCEFVFDQPSGNWMAFLGGASTPLVAFPVDASAAPVTITLPASTGSGNIRFYTLRDSTNAATLAVQTGEHLNGVLNGTFAFSDSDVGTQFIATDRAAGRWDVAAVGGSLPLITDATLATGTNSNVASALAVKTYVDNSVATPPPGVSTPIGSMNRSVYVVYPMATLPRYFATGSDVQSIETAAVAFTPVTPTSTATALLRAPRTDWTMSGSVETCGIRSTSSPVSMFTGFSFRMRYGLAQGWSGVARHYCGIHSIASVPTTNSDPSTNMTNFLMFGWDNADANCQIMIRGAGGAAQKINLGATMPKLSGALATNTFGFDVTLELPKNAAVGSILKYSVTRLNNGVNVSGEVALTVAPASNTVLGFGSSFIGTAAADRRFSLLGLELSNEPI
jgi:hypothetical protein